MRLTCTCSKNNMCLNPKWIYKTGNYKEDNYRGRQGEFYELGTYAQCGVCEICQNNKSNNWVVRNNYESMDWGDNACFVTLTYKNPPIFLVRKDFQDWLKRFRHEINKEYIKEFKKVSKYLSKEWLEAWKEEHKDEFIKTRVFYAGEYGERNGRAHFHCIIYGWKDDKPNYLGLSGRGNILYQSNIIQKTWGLGRTSYQKFTENKEAIYMSLYQTAGEEFKRAYKLNKEKAKQIERYVNNRNPNSPQYKNLLNELNEAVKEMERTRAEWLAIREFNGWSIALGWNAFERNYLKSAKYTWEENIFDRVIPTPTPWIKKLANKYGDIAAAEEMFRRERELEKSASEEQERQKNLTRARDRRKKEIMEYNEKGRRKNGEIITI